MCALFRTISDQSEIDFDQQVDYADNFNESFNELIDAFTAFTEKHYVESNEILNNMIEKYKANSKEDDELILSRLNFLRSQSELKLLFQEKCTNEQTIEWEEDANGERLHHSISIGRRNSVITTSVIEEKDWNIEASQSARNTVNPIRRIVDRCKLMPNPDKPMISLSIGDPTCYGNMLPPVEASQAVNEVFAQPTSHGYVPSCGTEEAREAIAKLWSRDDYVLDSKDIILTSGCSHALEMCINCIADVGDNILLPQPGFSLYITLCESLHIEPRFYKLKPEENWEIDLNGLEASINSKTKAVLVNNPSNPCGTVYSDKHLKKILKICEKHRLPVIADEIYADMVFTGSKFHFMGVLSERVPILSCGGLAKRYICPGWRIGWIAMYDRLNIFKESIRSGLLDLSSRILGPNSVMQAALPKFLSSTPQKYFDDIMDQIQNNAEICHEILSTAPGLESFMPQAAMYMLIALDPSVYEDIEDDKVFFTKLFNEQSISCLPASVFGIPNYFRLVLTTPLEKTREACKRIVEFCHDHVKTVNRTELRSDRSVTSVDVGEEGLAKPEESSLPFHTKSSQYK